jgi:chromosome partitioning protein
VTCVLAVTNQKGGVGKTTTCVNLAASLAMLERRVLLTDMDPQANATTGCGEDKKTLTRSMYDVLTGGSRMADVLVRVESSGFDLAPSNADLTAAEVTLLNDGSGEYRLRDELIGVRAEYDYVLIDCPPALNMLTINSLVAADGVMIPMQCEYYALEGLSALLETVEGVRRRANPSLHIEGLLRTMYDPRNSLTRDVSRQLISHFKDKVYRTVIPRNVRLAEAPSHGVPALVYDRYSRGAIAYQALAREIDHQRVDA